MTVLEAAGQHGGLAASDVIAVVALVVSGIALFKDSLKDFVRRHRLRAELSQMAIWDQRGPGNLLDLVVTSENRTCTVESFELAWTDWEDWVKRRPKAQVGCHNYEIGVGPATPVTEATLAAVRSGGPLALWRKELRDGRPESWVVEPSTNDPEFAADYRQVRAVVRTSTSRAFRRETRVVRSNAAWVKPRLIGSYDDGP